MGMLLQNLRYSWRVLRKNTTFGGIVVLALTLGIGANTAIFTVTYDALLRPMPYPHSERLVSITTRSSPPESTEMFLSPPAFNDLREQNTAFERIAASDPSKITITGQGVPEQLDGLQVSGDYFAVYGVRPFLGRTISDPDMEPGNNKVAVLSYEFWQRRFGGDTTVIGKRIILSVQSLMIMMDHASPGTPHTIIGVMPPRSQFPNYAEIWVPLSMWDFVRNNREFRVLPVVARLKPRTDLKRANAELHTIAAHLAFAHPDTENGWDMVSASLRNELTPDMRGGLLTMLAAVSFVLLLTCVSVSSVMVSRGLSRHQEIAIRLALGATRLQVVVVLLTESFLLAFFAGLFGFLLSFWLVRILSILAPPTGIRLEDIHPDWTAFTYTALVTCLTAFLFGLTPAWQSARAPLATSLKRIEIGSEVGPSTRGPFSARNLLVVIEIALAFILVVSAALSIRSFSKLQHITLGYRVDHILTMSVHLSPASCANFDVCEASMSRLLGDIRSLPGVDSAAITAERPMGRVLKDDQITPEGRLFPKNEPRPEVELHTITPDYFRTVGISLLAGRDFTEADSNRAPFVAIVNQRMALELFNGSALGKRFNIGSEGSGSEGLLWREIVGIVGDTRGSNPAEMPAPALYLSFSQSSVIPATILVLRTTVDPDTVAAAVRERVWSIDREAPISDVATMAQIAYDSTAEPRFLTVVLSAFGGLALFIALLGVYGVISTVVSQRTREIGIRMALGSQPQAVLYLFLREGMLLAGAGVALGMVLCLAVKRLIGTFLLDFTRSDSITMMGVGLLFCIVVLAACYFPARRAATVDPVIAIRCDYLK